MSYEQWKSRLFEEAWPRLRFEGGSLSWQKDETIAIDWGGKSYVIELDDIYAPETQPVESIMEWCWKNLPITAEELPESYVWWSSHENSFRAGILRPNNVIYTQTVSPSPAFTRFGKSVQGEGFDWKLSGGVMTVTSSIKGIPALCPLSHPITFNTVVSEYFEPSEDILVAFSPYEVQHVFVGHKDVVQRICDEDRGVLGISSSQWNTDITQALERVS